MPESFEGTPYNQLIFFSRQSRKVKLVKTAA
jgi:hypothetical protein